MRLLALSAMAAAGSAAVLPSPPACSPCNYSSVSTVTVPGPTVTVTLLSSIASSSPVVTTTLNGTLTYTNVVTVQPSSSTSEASSFFVVTNNSTSWLSGTPTDTTYVIGTTTIFITPAPETPSSLTGGAVPTSNGEVNSTVHLTSVITLSSTVVETVTALTPYETGISYGTGLPYGTGVGPSGSGWNATSSPSSTEGSGVFGTVSDSGTISSSAPSASASSASPNLSTGYYPSAPYGSPFVTSSSSSSAPSSSVNATSSSALSSTEGSGVFGNATSWAASSLSTGYYLTAPYGSPVVSSSSSALSSTQGSGVFGNATSTYSPAVPSDTCTEEGASSTLVSAIPLSTSSNSPGYSVTPSPYYPNVTSSAAASPSATSNGTATTPTPTFCGESGNFTLNWDDEPAFSPDQPGVDPWVPVFNPYHHMFFSNGYAYIPPGADNEPFAAISRPNLAIFLPNVTDSDVGSPNAAGVNAGEIGAGPRSNIPAYLFDVYGVFVGCDNPGPGDCELLTSGWQWDEEAQQEVITVVRNDTIKPCAVGMLNCQLTEIVYDEYFRNLSGIQFQAKVNNASSIFLLDNLSMGWSNNSCEAGLLRQRSRK